MKSRWIGFVAARFVSRNRRNSPAVIFSALGIATGVLALTIIIAVMNGFQLGFIESILEISSGHLRVEYVQAGMEPSTDLQNAIKSGSIDKALEDRIRELPGVVSAVPFRETSILIRGRGSNPRGAVLRGLPPDVLEYDQGLAGKLVMEGGYFDLGPEGSIVLGAELARHLSVWTGDTVTVFSLSGGLADDENINFTYTVTGIFRCGFYEYDLGWAFINIDRAARLAGAEERPVLGIKLANRWQDQRNMAVIKKLLNDFSSGENDFSVTSWRDYNRSFFSALRTEKLMMFILVGLIFIVVGLNIFQSQRRTVLERREEIGMLRAMGASDAAVRLVFVWDGFIIGFAGAALGLVVGLSVAFNISAFFTILENSVNFFISLVNSIAKYFGAYGTGYFAVFSPAIFYIKEIPSRVIPHEAILIFLFGFFSALMASWFASGKASSATPTEVLRYE